jgi:hypothetical protein
MTSSVSTTNVVHYDARGRVVQGNQQTDGETYDFSYTYFRDNSLKSITYDSGRVVSYSYDVAGRATGISGTAAGGQTPTSYASNVTYAPHGAIEQMLLGSNKLEQHCYNNRLQPVGDPAGRRLHHQLCRFG